MVLDPKGGPLGQMLFAFEFGLGGPFGVGEQLMNWITCDDLARLIFHAIRQEQISGPINAISLGPVSNKKFSDDLGMALNRPSVFAIPSRLISVLLDELGKELFLANQNIRPRKAVSMGFIRITLMIRSILGAK